MNEDPRDAKNENPRRKEPDRSSPGRSAEGDRGSGDPSRPLSLSHDEMLRYSRHLIMPEITITGQLELKAASVLLVGAGGLGAPAGLYLAAAGVGRIGVVDFDVVDTTNLQRQITFGTADVGKLKVHAAVDRLRDLNREIEIVPHEAPVTSEHALDLFSEYDIIVDGTDNFPTRYLVNDACVLLGKPDVYGGVFRFQGQASVFGLADGPCYRCLHSEPPRPGSVPNCAEGGVVGALPGVIGSIQALETIKLILGVGESLKGRLLLFDALRMRFREVHLPKNPACPVCGSNRTIRNLVDYEDFCGTRAPGQNIPEGVPEIAPRELETRLSAGGDIDLVDVRQPHERLICHLGGRVIPLSEIPDRVLEIDRSRDTIIYCRSGARSAAAVAFLRRAGFERVWNLRGGLLEWSDEVDPTFPKY